MWWNIYIKVDVNIKREIKNEFSYNLIKGKEELTFFSYLLDNFKIKICLKDPRGSILN